MDKTKKVKIWLGIIIFLILLVLWASVRWLVNSNDTTDQKIIIDTWTVIRVVTEWQLLDEERLLQREKQVLLEERDMIDKEIEIVDKKILDKRKQRDTKGKPSYLQKKKTEKLSNNYDPTVATPRVIRHKGYPEDSLVQLYANMAYQISDWDMEFIAMLEWENWQRNPYRQSEVVKDWVREKSYGFCQLHINRHSEVINDDRFRDNHERQLEQCYNKWKWWTKFYWYNTVLKNRFTKV